MRVWRPTGLVRYQTSSLQLQKARSLWIEGKACFAERDWSLLFVAEESRSTGAGGKLIAVAVERDWTLVIAAAGKDWTLVTVAAGRD